MSAAILYLAIVAIWAFLLVPRWVRRSHAAPASNDSAFSPAVSAEPPEASIDSVADPQEEPDTGPIPAVTAPPLPEPTSVTARVQPAPPEPAPPEPALPEPALPEQAPPEPARQWHQTGGPARPPISRTKILQARRRLLTMLVLLAIAAVSCTELGLASWWVCIPPAVMLGMYLLLLHEAALADAETARWRVRQAHAARQRARSRQAWAARTPQPTAQIIDISARLGDQLYDQYADATVRAVGD